MKNAILNYENIFYLDYQAISGIISVDGSYSINYTPINTIGIGYNKQVIADVPTVEFNINKYLLYNEPLLNYTGQKNDLKAPSFAGSINYNNRSIGFQSGYLNSFGLSCAVGEVPKTSANIQVFGDVGSGYSASGNRETKYMTVPQVKDIVLSCSGSSSNRVTSFDYSINCPKKPIYILQSANNYVPYEVLSDLPIEITISFNLEVDDYDTKRLYQQLNNDIDSSFSLLIKGVVFQDENLLISSTQNLSVGLDDLLVATKSAGVTLFSQSFNNFKIVSQEFSSNADDVLSVKLNYKGYLN
ncbi:hypothetical protein EB169_00265 [archaeon]|nr:hypothetical protein [archaeon]NDB54248.1 hypothetical protein [archaeon]